MAAGRCCHYFTSSQAEHRRPVTLCGMNFGGGVTFCFRQHSLWLGVYFLAMNDAIFLSVHLSSQRNLFHSFAPSYFLLSCFSRGSLYSTEAPHTVIKGTNPNIRLDFFNTMVQTYGLHIFFFFFLLLSNFFPKFLFKKCVGGLVRWLNFYKLLLSTPKALV